MKLLSFTILVFLSLSSNAVEFNSCTDNTGKTHFTNLPISSLDSNCVPKDRYKLMLNEDYLNLSNVHNKYVDIKKTAPDLKTESESYELNKDDTRSDLVSHKILDIFDSDKALDQLVSKDRDDAVTKAFKGRTKAVEGIMEQEKP